MLADQEDKEKNTAMDQQNSSEEVESIVRQRVDHGGTQADPALRSPSPPSAPSSRIS